MTAARDRVLIVGGGIAGLSAAIALQELDLDIVLVERKPTFAPIGAGISLAPNAVLAFDRLGVGASIRAAGYWQRKCVLRTADGSVVGTIDVTQWTNDRVCIHRGRLHEILRQGARDVQVRLGTVVSALDPSDGNVRVRFSDGTEDSYALVVAADGYRSSVRSQVVPGAGVVFTGANSWRVALKAPLPDGWTWQLGSGLWLHAIQIGDGMVYASASVRSIEPLPTPQPGDLTKRFKDFGLPLRGFVSQLDGPSARFSWVFEAAQDTWIANHIAFVGDAAHALPSILGQGAAMAAEDAIVLAEEVGSHNDLGSALAAYQTRRESRLVMMRALAHRLMQRLKPGFQGSASTIADMLREQDEAVLVGP